MAPHLRVNTITVQASHQPTCMQQGQREGVPVHGGTVSLTIASACVEAYDSLPPRGKPGTRSNGQPEWTVLAGMMLVNGQAQGRALHVNDVRVVSLGTGVKCLPANRLPKYGDVLHDCHAEVIARRGFMLWLYEELERARLSDNGSEYLVESPSPRDIRQRRWRLRDGWKVYMYGSTLPCGDASMLHLAKLQDPSMAANYADVDTSVSSTTLSRGRRGFLHQGALRTKPARADAITTTSLSCSDKLASWTILGIQGALLSHFIDPICVDTYIFGGVSKEHRQEVELECERALYGRIGTLEYLPHPSKQVKPKILFTDLPFVHSKELVQSQIPQKELASSVQSLSWIVGLGSEIIGGKAIKEGSALKSGDQPQKPNARSRLCKVSFLKRYLDLSKELYPLEDIEKENDTLLYWQTKQAASAEYKAAKHSLRDGAEAPFKEWIITGKEYNSFTLNKMG